MISSEPHLSKDIFTTDEREAICCQYSLNNRSMCNAPGHSVETWTLMSIIDPNAKVSFVSESFRAFNVLLLYFSSLTFDFLIERATNMIFLQYTTSSLVTVHTAVKTQQSTKWDVAKVYCIIFVILDCATVWELETYTSINVALHK